jgi:hypothetical protein
MNIQNDGGPAFPTPAGIQHNDGMTLRDYFAAAALQGLMANPNQIKSWREYVECAYQTADVMLKAREAKP